MGSDYELPDYYGEDDRSGHQSEPQDNTYFSGWWIVLWLVVADISTIFWLAS